MLKSASSTLWVCSKCVRRLSTRRCLSTTTRALLQAAQDSPATSATHNHNLNNIPVSYATSTESRDDALLRQMFDDPSRHGPVATISQPAGLFGNAYLRTPQGFHAFARQTIRRAEVVVNKVLAASNNDQMRQIVGDLDRLSDLLCRVLDVADFVRMTHPSSAFQGAANDAWSIVYQYMNELNTNSDLSDKLGQALANDEVRNSWTEEERTVAEILQSDFKKSADKLPLEVRKEFVSLSQEISEAGASFVNLMRPQVLHLNKHEHELTGMPDGTLEGGGIIDKRRTLPTFGSAASTGLRRLQNETVRRELYLASRTASTPTIHVLEDMLLMRGRLAKIAGFESYAHMALKDRMMAKNPAAVMRFLEALWDRNTPKVRDETQQLTAYKRRLLGKPTEPFNPWDKFYYMEKLRTVERLANVNSSTVDLSAYLSLGTVMQGISRLFSRLFGIRFVPRNARQGETWHDDVRRLDVVTDAGNLVAVLYCDLFYRRDKSPNPAHFTVRCSRLISAGEVAETATQIYGDSQAPNFATPEEAANDGMETSNVDGVLMQLPTIALVCDFSRPALGAGPALLSLSEVETLFHEMGHAVHSILARTSLQNVSGTRCATDFAELPSTLMEQFATNPDVLALFARHWSTDEPLPYKAVAERRRTANRFEGSDIEHQIILAILDQEYHSPAVVEGASKIFEGNTKSANRYRYADLKRLAHKQNMIRSPTQVLDTTSIYHDIYAKYSNGPGEAAGTRWQGFFGHLNSYGSTYYSYLFDRVLAERVWRVVFSGGKDGAAISRENGERLHRNLLRWGGGRDPWRCLSDTLQDERLAAGDESAMELVGSWGFRSE